MIKYFRCYSFPLSQKSWVKSSEIPLRRYSQNTDFKRPKTILSGIQPTGTLHIGNYFGAVLRWKALQEKNENVILCIADLHSITLPQNPEVLKSSVFLMTASLLACGIDPSKSTIFQQSKVPEHASLSWVLGTLTTMTRLYHFPQYKEKSSVLKDIPLGLFTYPVLQAADILLYKATHVPVGEDQVQHLHLAQHLVHTFNNKYGKTFPLPECIVEENMGGSRIKSLREPDKKMSKSHGDPKSRIEITDSSQDIALKIKKAVTDFTSSLSYDPETRPGVSNLIDIHALLTGSLQEEICEEYAHLDTGRYKSVVAEALNEKLTPIRNEITRLLNSPDYLENVLTNGNNLAKEIAEATWKEVCYKVGLSRELPSAKSERQIQSA
ncbi:tryptophanyl-tRNA synthetase, mitochondrial [Rhodnius prolixus]